MPEGDYEAWAINEGKTAAYELIITLPNGKIKSASGYLSPGRKSTRLRFTQLT